MVGNKRTARRRGAAVAEFALIAPVVLVFVMGLCEMGQALSGATPRFLSDSRRRAARLDGLLWQTGSRPDRQSKDYS